MRPNPSIFLIAGEMSGDQLGGWLIAALKTKQPSIRFAGIGGPMMQAQGVTSLFPMRDINLMGFAEILPHIFKLKRRIRETVEAIEREKPDMLITIDSPGFATRVVKLLRARGIHRPKFVHYVAPTVWAYKPERAAKFANLFDYLLCLLPFEPPYFDAVKLPNRFIGHEITWWWKVRGDGAAFRVKHTLGDSPILAVFPGSRRGEIKRLWPIFSAAIGQLQTHIPTLRIVIQVPEYLVEEMRALIPPPFGGRLEPAPDLTRGGGTSQTPHSESSPLPTSPQKGEGILILPSTEDKKDLFAASTAAIAKSGTIGLECALAGLPHVIAYRANPITYYLIRKMANIRFAHLANILAGRDTVPELIQETCTPSRLVDAILPLLTSDAARTAQQAELATIAAQLGANDSTSPSEKAAEMVLGMLV